MTAAGVFTERSQPPQDRSDAPDLPFVAPASLPPPIVAALPPASALEIERLEHALTLAAEAFAEFRSARDWDQLASAAYILREALNRPDIAALSRRLNDTVTAARLKATRPKARE
jgi:hypothetical protein